MGFGGLYISISGLNANKKALDTVSHNIANVDNANYVRQSAIHAESRYSTNAISGYQTGSGVDVQKIRQIRDEFLDAKLRREQSIFGYFNTKSEILNEIEIIFNEITSSGFQNVLDDFWNAWSELYKEPDSLTVRGLLHERAVALTTTANHISTQLNNLQFNLNKEMLNASSEVNSLLERIADLNNRIKLVEGHSPNISANDFRDERNDAMDKLSELIPINYYENRFGEIVITLNGRDLINGDYFNPLNIQLNKKGHGEVYWTDTGEKIELKGLGELGGYIDARDEVVIEYRDRLNILMGVMAEKINNLHKDGTGLDGEPGEEFFVFSEDDVSATIRINSELEDFNKIVAGKTEAKGDGDIAKEILALRESLMYGNYNPQYDSEDNLTLNIDDFYRELILNLSLERAQAKDMALNQIMLMNQIGERRQEISSVSLDEEMANMLKYQHSYVANSRVINAIDEMIETIVTKVGLVGR